ncbi:hypothetical protein MRX96_058728 [Rhipicephalus microplus]
MPSFCFAHGCLSTDGRDDVIRELLAGDNSIEQTSKPSVSGQRDYDDIAAEPVYKAGQSLAYESGQALETPPQLVCEQHQVIDKSVQVGLLTHHEASQANEEKILSTSATQTEPQAVSSGFFDESVVWAGLRSTVTGALDFGWRFKEELPDGELRLVASQCVHSALCTAVRAPTPDRIFF